MESQYAQSTRSDSSAVADLPLLAASSKLFAAGPSLITARQTHPSVDPERTLLLKNADLIATMDDERQEIRHGSILIKGNVITAVGKAETLPQQADDVIDLKGHIAFPG